MMDRVIEGQPFDVDPDELARDQARQFRRFFLARLGMMLVATWFLAWPVPVLPHTAFWTLLATTALVIGLTSPSRHH